MRIPRIETLILIICFLAVVLWAVRKCNSTRSTKLASSPIEQEERPIKRDTVFVRDPAVAAPQSQPQVSAPVSQEPYRIPSNPGEVAARQPTQVAPPTASSPAPVQSATKPQTQTVVKNQTVLYVTIDGLKLRKEPGLKADLVAKLELYEPVYYLGEKTDYTQEINLGYDTVTDYWVKVKTKSGKVGWVFGAGVHYYKQKRKGVME